MLPYVVFSLGSYFIVSDLAEEQKRGTLNFIRLSPRPAWQILLGKLLGIPVLLYLSIAFAIPLHCFAGLRGGGFATPNSQRLSVAGDRVRSLFQRRDAVRVGGGRKTGREATNGDSDWICRDRLFIHRAFVYER
ncbi:MAG: ABC transporter permease [Microcoleus sp. SU_5_6]|nr:ABC transporter permease [Microcoleus sp. SU_5_6]